MKSRTNGNLIGERIQFFREAKSLTMRGLADAVQISASTISRLEKGQVPIKQWQVERFAKYFGISEDALTKN